MTTLFDQTTVPTIDPNKDYYAELVGEGKTYKDNLAAGRAIAEKDLFIERLKAETAAMRDELTKAGNEIKTRTSLDEFLNKVKEAQTSQTTRSTENNQGSEPAALTEDKIADIIEQRLKAKDTNDRQNTNIQVVQEGLKKVFGPNFISVLEEKTQELGVTKEFLDNLARTAPKAFFSTLGINPTESRSVFAPESTISSKVTGAVKNYAYYQELKKKIGSAEFYSPRVQNEMFEQAKKLGDAF